MDGESRTIADQLIRQLDLPAPPIQISYLDEAPQGVREHPGRVPSACTFFAKGADSPFYAGIRAHEECEVGAFVLGIPPAGDLGRRLEATIGEFQRVGYLAPGEGAAIPHNDRAPKFVAYGPLGSLPVPPTAVLLFARPRSAMLALEAARSTPGAPAVPMNGRPMCAVVPLLNQGAPFALSLGCTGSRIYTGMGDDRMVIAIRGDHLRAFARQLDAIVRANAAVAREDEGRKAASVS